MKHRQDKKSADAKPMADRPKARNRITGIEPVVSLKPPKEILTEVIKKGIEDGSIKILQEERLTLTEQREIVRKLNRFLDEEERIQEVIRSNYTGKTETVYLKRVQFIFEDLMNMATILTNRLAEKTYGGKE